MKKILPFALSLFLASNALAANFKGNVEPYAAPEISGINKWFNSNPLKISDLKGKVVLIDFWTYSCINCIRTLPHMNELQKKYGDKGLVIIGIHAPEFAFEKNDKNVAAAIERFGIKYAVAMDNDLQTWNNFQNRYWPAHYLINQQGEVVYTHFGEGAYDVMEKNISALLNLSIEAAEKRAEENFTQNQSPETYLGLDRGERNANTTLRKLAFPKNLSLHNWALNGSWKIYDQYSQSTAKNAALRFNFHAKKVFLVMDSADKKTIKVAVKLDGNEISTEDAGIDVHGGSVAVSDSRLYELIDLSKAKDGVLEIISSRPGLRVYAFTFG